jgi:toxin ParE1/3/4
MKVEISTEAEGDLETIGDYIGRDDPERAIRFLREIRTKCLDLADMPNGFPLVGRYKDMGIRQRVSGNYLIFYRVYPKKIIVLHILHGARDYPAILFNDDRLNS